MAGATIYMAYRDALNNYYVNEYYSASYQAPQTISPSYNKLVKAGTTGRSAVARGGDFHLVFQRPVTAATPIAPDYYQFKQGDKSNLLLATNLVDIPASANDFMRHSSAEIRKIDFFQTAPYNECTPPTTVPAYIAPTAISELSDIPERSYPEPSSSNQASINLFFTMFIVIVSAVLCYSL
jgi:hypothetical protein